MRIQFSITLYLCCLLGFQAFAKPHLYILSIGVSKYKDTSLNLGYAAKDAADIGKAFDGQKGKVFDKIESHILTDDQASMSNIQKEFGWLRQVATQQDLVIVFLAGHSTKDRYKGDYYYCTHETDPDDLVTTGLPTAIIANDFNNLPCKGILILDGGISTIVAKGNSMSEHFVKMAETVSSHADGKQRSLLSSDGIASDLWQNGALAKAFLEGLAGKADFEKSGTVPLKALLHFVEKRVKELSSGRQRVQVDCPTDLSDFPIAIS